MASHSKDLELRGVTRRGSHPAAGLLVAGMPRTPPPWLRCIRPYWYSTVTQTWWRSRSRSKTRAFRCLVNALAGRQTTATWGKRRVMRSKLKGGQPAFGLPDMANGLPGIAGAVRRFRGQIGGHKIVACNSAIVPGNGVPRRETFALVLGDTK